MSWIIDKIRELWANEPVRVVSVAASVIVFAAAKFGIVVPEASVVEALAIVIPILLGGEVARAKVTPT